MTTATGRSPLFVYPALREIRLCFAVVIAACFYAWYCVYDASKGFKFQVGTQASVYKLPLVGERFKDESNWEWQRWEPFARTMLPWLIGHSVIFNLLVDRLPNALFTCIILGYSLVSCVYMFTARLLLLSLLQGTFVFVISNQFRQRWAVWVSALPLLYYTMHHTEQLGPDPFVILVFVSYCLLAYISFNLDTLSGYGREEDAKSLLSSFIRMLYYVHYLPYVVSLIVLYGDFERQMRERETRKRNWREIIIFGGRIMFWWLFVEFLLYFFYFEAILHDLRYAYTLPKDRFVSLGMAIGTFFQLKYVVIFGMPSFFARLDKMQPLPGPICLIRVSLYSKIWRGFDRGLYAFFKQYIFLPICAPTFSLPRKIFGVLISYGFVLLWHGFHHHNIVWIVLNILELFMEKSAQVFYAIDGVRKWREQHLSDENFRRVLGWLHLVPLVFGLYSNFYFLGGSAVGYAFVQRIFWEETVTLRYPFFLLISFGWFYTQVNMEVDRWKDASARSAVRVHQE